MEPDVLDSLTGLLNRRGFDSKLHDALASYTDSSGIVAVILADLDQFKLVNDTFGHRAGDEVLRSVARLLQTHARGDVVACRYGGDEFIVLCPGTTEPRAQQLALRIETEARSLVVNWEGRDIGPVPLSTGLAYCPRDGKRAEDLIEAADVALLRKKGGDDGGPASPAA